MRRFFALIAVTSLLSFTAVAQDTPPPDVETLRYERDVDTIVTLAQGEVIPAPVPAVPSVWAQLGPALADLLSLALLAGIGFLATFLRAKQAESKAARVGLVVTEAARSVVLELDATMKPKLKAYLADGVLSDDEKADLKQTALYLLKTKLPSGLLATAGGIFGAFTATYLAGKVEQAVAEKNAVAAAGLTSSPQ